MHLISHLTSKSILALIRLEAVITTQCEVQMMKKYRCQYLLRARWHFEKNAQQRDELSVTLNHGFNLAKARESKWDQLVCNWT